MPHLEFFFDNKTFSNCSMYVNISYKELVSNMTASECQKLAEVCLERVSEIQSIELTEEEKVMVRRGEVIQAIKCLRNRTGLKLFDAKQEVDKYRV